MTVLNKLATSLNRRDEVPNQELAKEIVATTDTQAIKELVDNLAHKDKNIQSDCLKVLYEIGEQQPALISAHAGSFLALLDSTNNRLQWGAMSALNAIAAEKPALIYPALAKLAAVAGKGSVITKDNYVSILIKLCAEKKYADSAFALLNEQLLTSATNQLPMYAENALPVIDQTNKAVFVKTLLSRLDDFEKETKRKRVEKVLKKLQGK